MVCQLWFTGGWLVCPTCRQVQAASACRQTCQRLCSTRRHLKLNANNIQGCIPMVALDRNLVRQAVVAPPVDLGSSAAATDQAFNSLPDMCAPCTATGIPVIIMTE